MWKTVKLGDVCELATGGTPSRKKKEYFDNGTIKWLVSGDINQREIYDCEGRITEDGLANSNAKYLPENSVLIALNGQGKTRGTVALLRTRATCNQSLVSISPKIGVALDTKFLFYVLDGMYQKIRTMTGDSGNDRRGLNMPLIRSIDITLPPLAEQQRIVAKLDAAFAEIDRATELVEAEENEAEILKGSFLKRWLHNDGAMWTHSTLGGLCKMYQPKTISTKEMVADGEYVVFGANGIIGRHDKYNHEEPQLLVTCRGATCGAVNVSEPYSWINGNAMVIQPDLGKVSLKYMEYLFRGGINLISAITGAAQPQITRKSLEPIQFSYPPLAEQQRIVAKLDAAFAEFEKHSSALSLLKQGYSSLKSSILAQELQPPQSDAA